MKKKLLVLFYLNIFLSVFSFAQTANVSEGCVPLQVSFQAPSTSTNYYWDFKDGVTSDKKSPINIFNKPGTYNVIFKESVTGPVLGTIQIKVYEDPKVNIKVLGGCAPLNAQFQNLTLIDPSIEVKNYLWVFGDGQGVQGVENPTHYYGSNGSYDVSFSIETEFPTCNKTVIFSKALEVIPPPSASFATNPASLSSCNDTLTVAFKDFSTGVKPLTYSWNFGNGKSSNVKTPAAQKYLKGQYTAALTVSYANIPGCTSTISNNISVGKPSAKIIKTKDTVCLDNFVMFKTPSKGIYLWEIGSNATAADFNNDFNPDVNRDSVSVSFSTPGIHTVKLTVRSLDGLCSDVKTETIFVDGLSASIQNVDSFSCKSPVTIHYKAISNQTNVNYKWNFPFRDSSNLQAVTKTYYSQAKSNYYDKNLPDFFITTLKVTSNRTGCVAYDMHTLLTCLPTAKMVTDKHRGCAPLKVSMEDFSFSPTQIQTWKWLFGDGTSETKSNSGPVTHTYTTPGEYLARLMVITKDGCVDTSYAILIEVGSDLSSQIDFTSDKNEVCPGEEFLLKASIAPVTAKLIDAYHFGAEKTRLFHCDSENQATWSFNHEAGPQEVSLTVDYNGCYSTIKKTSFVNVKGAIAKIDYSALCSNPMVYNFKDQSKNANTLTWDFGDGNIGTAGLESHTFANTGDYKVKLTASNSDGCSATTDTTTVRVRNLKSNISIDTLLCINASYTFSAVSSKDVYASCHTGYTWQFPDRDKRPLTTSNTSASFLFDSPGKYTVNLITKDINGCKDTAIARFKVYDMVVTPQADKNLICNPATVNFTDLSVSDTTIVSYFWDFTDGGQSNLQNPTHTFVKRPLLASNYSVMLILKDKLGCTENAIMNVQHYTPVSPISFSDPTLCLGDSVVISAPDFTQGGSHLTFSWDFGNGESSTAQTNKILYKAAQSFNVNLNFTEIASGCSGTSDSTIQIQEYPIADITTNVDTLRVLCAPQNMFFKDHSQSSSPISYYWNFGNGQSTLSKDYSLFYSKGTFNVKHIVSTSFGCSDTISQTYKVFKPEGQFDIDKNTICKGEEIKFSIRDTADVSTFTWAFGDGTILNDQAPVSHKYNFHPPSGATPARLVIRGKDGICPNELQKIVNIHEVIAEFDRENGGDTSICFNDGPYHFTNKSIGYNNFLWSFGDGLASTELNPVHSFVHSGVYDVTLSVSNNSVGCKDTIVKKAIIYDNPKVVAVGDTVCLGSEIQLSVSNPENTSTYLWTPSIGLSDNSVINPIATLQHTQNYKVIETDTNACSSFANVPAVVIEPIAFIDWDTSIVIGDQIALPVFGPKVYNFQWTPEEGLSCLDCNYPLVRPLSDIKYELNVTDVRGCFSSTVNFDITVKPETFIKLPSAFSPNGDGANDVVFVKGWGIKKLLFFQIFNRWGQLVYSSNEIDKGWDGKLNGVEQNSDVYVYKVKVVTWKDEELFTEGYINLIH